MDEFTALENEYWHNLTVKIPKLNQEVKGMLDAPMMRAKLGDFLARIESNPEAMKLFDELDGLYGRQIELRKRLTELEYQRQNS